MTTTTYAGLAAAPRTGLRCAVAATGMLAGVLVCAGAALTPWEGEPGAAAPLAATVADRLGWLLVVPLVWAACSGTARRTAGWARALAGFGGLSLLGALAVALPGLTRGLAAALGPGGATLQGALDSPLVGDALPGKLAVLAAAALALGLARRAGRVRRATPVLWAVAAALAVAPLLEARLVGSALLGLVLIATGTRVGESVSRSGPAAGGAGWRS